MDSSVRGLMRPLYHYCFGVGMANLWRACSKWHAGRFTSQPAFTAVPFFKLLLLNQRIYIVKNVCVCVCVYIYIYTYTHTHTHTHTHRWLRADCNYRCYQIVLQVKHFYTNREVCEVLSGYISLERQPGGDWTNTWYWTERFTVFFQTGSSTSPSYFQIVFLTSFL